MVQAQFSIPYTVAAALVTGGVGLNDLSVPALSRPEILALAARIECRVDDEIEATWGRSISPAHVEVETENGTFSHRVDYPRGHVRNRMTRADFEAKMAGCLAASDLDWPVDTVTQFRATVDGLKLAPSGRSVLDGLTR